MNAGGKAPFTVFMNVGMGKLLGSNFKPGMIYGVSRGHYPAIGASATPWVNEFKRRYHQDPEDSVINGIGGFLAYKAAVEKAQSLDPTKIMTAYRCLTFDEPRGWIHVRALNGEADAPSWVGPLVPKQGALPAYDPKATMAVFGHQVWQSDTAVKKQIPADDQRTAASCTKKGMPARARRGTRQHRGRVLLELARGFATQAPGHGCT